MQIITSSEVTKAPGKIFDRAFQGETILVTRHGRPYVLLSPPPQDLPVEPVPAD
ncbi:type II toxin-antitoxin system Phd/YefM family antitoxin [Streptomyces sp. NPDC001251]